MALQDLAKAKGFDGYGAAIWNNPAQLGNATYMGNVNADCNFYGWENDLKANPVMNTRGLLNFSAADPIASAAQSNGKKLYGNTLIWGNYDALPGWLRTGSIPASQLLPLMTQYVQETIKQYKNKTIGWHVVNEQFANGPTEAGVDSWGMRRYSYGNTSQPIPWYNIPDYDLAALLAAKGIDPSALLGINDYAFELDSEDWRRQKCLARLEYLLSKGAKIDFLGSQTHIRAVSWGAVSGPKFNQFVNDLASLGVKTHITELDYEAGSETRLAEILDVVRSNPNITLVQVWEYGGPNQYTSGYQTISCYGPSYQKTALYNNLTNVFTNAVSRNGVIPVPPDPGQPPMPASPEGSVARVTDIAPAILVDADGALFAFGAASKTAGHKGINRNGILQTYTDAVIMYLHNRRVWQTNQVELNKAKAVQIWYEFGSASGTQAAVLQHTGSPIPDVVIPPPTTTPIDQAAARAQLANVQVELDKLKTIIG